MLRVRITLLLLLGLLAAGLAVGNAVVGLVQASRLDLSPGLDPSDGQYIVISPGDSTITAGSTETYTAELFDGDDNSLGYVTENTTFSIVESGHGGFWSANTYTSAKMGTWTVRGTYNGTLTDDASL
ncbi:MAG: hypothetical protein QUS33_07345, partial [Dehalococcoidia bacterium]|nr:hypothetical protein [Dehalococcoidia bacterium]